MAPFVVYTRLCTSGPSGPSHISRRDRPGGRTRTATDLTGDIGQRYAVEGELGRGGTAVVYRARDRVGGTSVAIKILREDSLGSLSVDRFLAEIRRTAQLSHAHIVPVLASGDHSGRPFFVLPFMDGGTLRDRLNRAKQLPFDEVIAIGVTIARALDFAHLHGVIHRDVKPENILFNNGQPCLADFGTARALERAANDPTTSTGIVRGTAAYMSPEQASAEQDYDGRTDIYSLGCVLYEAVAGIQPFVGPSAQAIITQRISHAPRPVSVYRPSTPPEFEAVLAKATAIAPGDRYQTAGDFADGLERVLPLVRNARAAAEARAARARSRRLQKVAGLAIVAVTAVAGLWYALKPPLSANDWLLIADFAGLPSDPTLAPSVRDLATQAFQQSRFVQIFDRRQLNEVMRRASVPETTTLNAARAREFAVRGAVSAVLQGSIRQMDSTHYELVMHIVRAEDGSSIASAVRSAGVADLPQAVQAIVDELRERIGEHTDAIRATRPLRQVTTPSFEAFRLYTASIDTVLHGGELRASNRLLYQAISLDSGFASAWYALGVNYVTMRLLDSARMTMERALSTPERLSVADLYRLKGDIAFMLDHDAQAAVQWYDRFVAESPRSSTGLTNRGFYKTAMGRYEEAVPDLKAAATMNPFGAAFSQPQILNYVVILVEQRRYDEARQFADSLSGWPAEYARTIIPVGSSRWAEAESVSLAASRNTTAPAILRIISVAAYASALAARGATGAADSVLSSAVATSRGSMARWFERGRLELSLAHGSIAPRSDLLLTDTTRAGKMLRALWSSVAGDTLRARRTLDSIGTLTAAQSAAAGTAPALTLAWIDLHGNRARSVVDRLGSIAAAGEHDPISLDRPDQFLLRWTVATAYEKMGRRDSAIAYFKLLSSTSAMPPLHLTLRGLSAPAAEIRISQLQGRSR
jgi:serine/threonine-protein kinase